MSTRKEPKQYTDNERKEIAAKLMRGLRDRMGVEGYIVSEGHGNSSDYEVALHDWPYQSVIVIRTPNTTKLAQITIRVVATAKTQCGAVQFLVEDPLRPRDRGIVRRSRQGGVLPVEEVIDQVIEVVKANVDRLATNARNDEIRRLTEQTIEPYADRIEALRYFARIQAHGGGQLGRVKVTLAASYNHPYTVGIDRLPVVLDLLEQLKAELL